MTSTVVAVASQPCPPTDWITAAINFATANPYIVVPFLVIALIIFAFFKGGGGKTISEIITHRADEKVVKARENAEQREAAAKELSESLLAQLELLRLMATTTAVSIQRFNDWLPTADHERYQADALMYLCDWTARLFSFAKSDICKVTLWRPTDRQTLEVAYYNGMSPESAEILELPIQPADPNDDTFAAMAFRSGRPEVCHDVGTDPRYHKLGRAPAHAYASIIAVPIRRAAGTVGVLTVDSLFKDNFRDPDQVQKAEICASLCGQFWILPFPSPAAVRTTASAPRALPALLNQGPQAGNDQGEG